MKNTDKLFVLIKSLNKNEKIYFKKYTKKANNTYLKLFDAISKQSSYNEEALLKKFANEKFSKQLHVIKNYLFNSLLKSLEDYHHGISLVSTLRSTLLRIELLHKKGLYHICSELLLRIKKQAEKTWKFTFSRQQMLHATKKWFKNLWWLNKQ